MDYGTILRKLGYRLIDRGSYWQTSALFRDGNNNTAISIFKNSGVWTDFVKGGTYPFEALLKKTLKTNDVSKYNVAKIQITERQLLKEEKIYAENCLGKLLPDYSFYNAKGIGTPILKQYQGGVATNGKLYNRFVFPIRNQEGKIHGFAARRLIEEDKYCKWLNWGKSAQWFYPYYTVKESKEKIDDTGEIILVESVGDSMACFQAGFENTAVAFTKIVSPFLLSNISVAAEKIFICLNGDEAGVDGCVKTVLKFCKIVDFSNIYFHPPKGCDFGDMTGELIKLHFDNVDHKVCSQNFLAIAERVNLNQEQKRQLLKVQNEYTFMYG